MRLSLAGVLALPVVAAGRIAPATALIERHVAVQATALCSWAGGCAARGVDGAGGVGLFSLLSDVDLVSHGVLSEVRARTRAR